MQVLSLQLQRGHWHPVRGFTKLNGFIRFPPVLDISPFIADIGTQFPRNGSQADMSEGQQLNSNAMYDLSAVIVHIGSGNQAHYYVYRRAAKKPNARPDVSPSETRPVNFHPEYDNLKHDEQGPNSDVRYDWWYISDQKSELCELEEVLGSQASQLLYERAWRIRRWLIRSDWTASMAGEHSSNLWTIFSIFFKHLRMMWVRLSTPTCKARNHWTGRIFRPIMYNSPLSEGAHIPSHNSDIHDL